jgi:hypothetical protein
MFYCIYRKLGNANIARTYIDTDSHKLKQLKVKIVIIICQTSNQSATMEQNLRKKYISIQFLNTGAKLLATRGSNLSKF